MFKVKQTTRRGFSLIELVLVVMVLAILAGFVIPLIGKLNIGDKSHKEVVTKTSMIAIRDAILGTATSPGAWSDLGQRPALFPTNPFWLTLEYEQLPESFKGDVDDRRFDRFDPVTKIGWRGPYLKNVNDGEGGPNALYDAWRQEIEIVVPNNDVTYARLVSRGEDEERDPLDGDVTGAANSNLNYKPGGPVVDYEDEFLTKEESDDDIVLFFFVGDNRQ